MPGAGGCIVLFLLRPLNAGRRLFPRKRHADGFGTFNFATLVFLLLARHSPQAVSARAACVGCHQKYRESRDIVAGVLYLFSAKSTDRSLRLVLFAAFWSAVNRGLRPRGTLYILTAKSTKNSPADAFAYFVPSNVRNGRLFAGLQANRPRFLTLRLHAVLLPLQAIMRNTSRRETRRITPVYSHIYLLIYDCSASTYSAKASRPASVMRHTVQGILPRKVFSTSM